MTNDNQLSTDETSTPPAAPQTSAPEPKATKSAKTWPLWILWLLTAGALAAACYYGWMRLQVLEKATSEKPAALEAIQQNLDKVQSGMASKHSSVAAKLEEYEDSLATMDKQLQDTMRRLMTQDPTGRTDWLMAETEYLLRLANQRLNMERDFTGALVILKAADNVLAEIDEAALYTVRKTLAEEIAALEAVAQVDRVGLFLKIEALIKQIESLDQNLFFKDSPLVEQALLESQSEAESEEPQDWREKMSAAAERLEKYIVIRRRDEPVEPLLAPEQIYYLQQNLRLMMEQASLALLDQNQALYTNSLDKAQGWVEKYFVTNDAVTKAMIKTLKELKVADIDPEVPEIGQSLRQLKGLMESVYQPQVAAEEAGE